MKTQLVIGLLAGLAFVGMTPSATAQADDGDANLACVGNVATSCAPGALCVGNVGVPVLGPNYGCGGNICVANAIGSCSDSLCVANVLTTCGPGSVCVGNTLTSCGGGWYCMPMKDADTSLCIATICVGNVATDCNAGICVANVLSTCNGPVCVGNVLTTCGTLWNLLYQLLAAFEKDSPGTVELPELGA